MKIQKLLFLIITIISIHSCSDSKQINIDLKTQLDSIYYKDQALRELYYTDLSESKKNAIMEEFGVSKEDYESKNWQLILKQDSLNLLQVEAIINEYGYPGRTLVGDSTYKAAWYVIQHSYTIEKYLPIIEEAGENGELDLTNVVMMKDRFLMEKGLEQIYGTQGTLYEGGYIIWPIKDVENVNKLRKEIGFETTIEEYAEVLGFEYKVVSLEDVKEYRVSMGYY